MSKNDLIVIYKFKNAAGQIVYLAVHACADTYTELTYAQFCDMVAGLKYTYKLSVAERRALQMQKKYGTEYPYTVCSDYLDAFSAVDAVDAVDEVDAVDDVDEVAEVAEVAEARASEVEFLRAEIQRMQTELQRTQTSLQQIQSDLQFEKTNVAKKVHEATVATEKGVLGAIYGYLWQSSGAIRH